MNFQEIYETQLAQYQDIVSSDLVPKVALYDYFGTRMKNDIDAVLKAEPLLNWIFQSLELDVILSLAKLLEGKKSDRNIIRFVDFCSSNRKKIAWSDGHIPSEIILAHRNLLAEQKETIENIASRRDKYLAHLDKEYFIHPERIYDDFPISTGDIVSLIRCFQKILGDHQFGLDKSSRISMEGFVYAGAEKMFNKLMSQNS